MQGEVPQWELMSERLKRWIKADLEEFFAMVPGNWGKIALLKAGELDPRMLQRIESGESLRTATYDSLIETMNKAARGELDPEDFRNRGNAGRPKQQSRASKEPNDGQPRASGRKRGSRDS